MSQDIFASIDPSISGTDLATALTDFKNAMVSGLSGTSRPTELDPGGGWIDTSNDPTTWSYKVWTGVDDVEVFVIDIVNGTTSVSLAVDSFIVRKVSADTVGAIMNLVKRRIASNGQVLSGDVVGEVRMVGRDNTGADPIVAKIIWTATENQTSSAYGGTLSFQSTPAGAAALVEHMRFIGGIVETVVPHKTNSQILTSQNIATTATIAQLSATKIVAEMTGATATDIQGINSGHDSKVITIHNRSSAIVTLKHQDLAAVAADRILLPENKDILLNPQESATLFYCTADTRWKIQYASSKFTGFTTDIVYGNVGEWEAPTPVTKVRITAHSKGSVFPNPGAAMLSRVTDVGRSMFAWGSNARGELGDGTVVNKSSPVPVLGSLKFPQMGGVGASLFNSSFGLTESGDAYMWGANGNGQLGVGDVLSRSSPVAVLGGLKFKKIVPGVFNMFGIAPDGTTYGWGINSSGVLGNGDVVPRSSPVAVLGGLKFREIITSFGNSVRCYGLTFDGTLYAWGENPHGSLGVGDLTPRSSPVAVLGGLKFKLVVATNNSTYAIAENGAAYSWGLNDYGQLGHGDVIPKSSPVAVLGGLVFQDLSANPMESIPDNVYGLTETQVLYAWGANDNGQLGVGDVIPRSSPVAVLGGLTFRSVIASGRNSFALTNDGTLYAWGFNADGQLGVGDVVPRSSPVAVLGGISFQEINTSGGIFESKFGLSSDGKLYAWGYNLSGELGVGNTVPRSSPVAVLGGLSLKTQDDSTVVLDIPVVGGNTYALKLGAGPCFFGSNPIGNNIQRVEITYVA